MRFSVMPDQFEQGRWLVCRSNAQGWATVVSSHLVEATANAERDALAREYHTRHLPVNPDAPRQIVFGFYTNEDAA